MRKVFSSFKDLVHQTPAEKMHVLKMVAHQMLGEKWVYFRKIKRAGEGQNIFHKKTMMEQMKATQAALKFSSRSTRKLYRLAYKNTLMDIGTNTGIKKSNFPDLPETDDTGNSFSTPPEIDATIIEWTPLKFLITARQIRNKGRATQRHSEGVVAKLFFKVVGYYASDDNWEADKLTLYLRKLDENSSYPDVATALRTFKSDISKFIDVYEPFKFGKASLSKDSSSDEDAFDDAMGVESFEEQVRSLYWFNFIYEGLELFLFKYYLTLISATNSIQAIRYITQLFEPALIKAIEVKNIFLGSFETDLSKKTFRLPFHKYRELRLNDPVVKKLKTSQGIFETYSYNLNLLKRNGLPFEFNEPQGIKSQWAKFINTSLLNGVTYETIKNETETKPIKPEIRDYCLMQIMTSMINCTQFIRRAKHQILERFEKRVEKDKELATNREKTLRRKADRQIRQLRQKAAKLRRMKQNDSADIYEMDIVRLQKKVENKCDDIRDDTLLELTLQKRRLQGLFDEISGQKSFSEGLTARRILELTDMLDLDGSYIRNFTKHISKIIQVEYSTEFEPFYNHLFDILKPSTQEKVILIQSLEKSGGLEGIKLKLTEDEEVQIANMINLLKTKIKHGMPNIFESKLVFATTLIPIDDIFKISINNQSLQTLLRLKIVSPKSARPFILKDVIVKALTVLNLVRNPVPKNNIILPGRTNMKDPQQAINGTDLHKLLAELA
jgi:hypothetical protein